MHRKIIPITLVYITAIFLCTNTVIATPLAFSNRNNQAAQLAYHNINIDQWLNNKAFGDNADFDGSGTSFTGTTNDYRNHLAINYNTHFQTPQKNFDNIKSNGQVIPFYKNMSLGALYLLVSTSHGPLTVAVNVSYEDGTQDTTTLSLPDWQDAFVDQMDRYEVIQYPLNIKGRQGALYSVPIFVNPEKTPVQLHLPQHDKNTYEAMHVFSITAYTSSSSSSTVIIASIKATNEWIDTRQQVIQVKIHNTSPYWIRDTSVSVANQIGLKAVKEGFVESIAPGHIQSVQVSVQKSASTGQQYSAVAENVTITIMYKKNTSALMTREKTHAILTLRSAPDQYVPTTRSVQKHRSPTWLKQSKFGIFIHWGLYSVPSWAPVGKSYAEWYWWRMNHKNDPAYDYHRQHYGENFEYDNFLSQWKPTLFDPHIWLDLIEKSRAKYFVFTTKHHDGIALFDTNVTDRSTTKLLQPNRDFVRELLSVSEAAYPHLKRGLYFSLPEWYHPSYRDDSLGWHGPPMNPYTGKQVAYTGIKAINSFVNELQVPQFQELSNIYKPDILWCDIGGIHNSTIWQSDYFNNALKNGRQVAVNDRCGDGSASDFTTVEYKAVKDTPSRFWETTRGMDPYSFGYNRETKPEQYASTYELIKDLVDAISRGGNFLLNIGPEPSGHIPEPMSQRLLEIGQWIDQVHASIFDSTPYWIASSEDDLRFTADTNGKSVYILSFQELQKEANEITINVPLPIQKYSIITLMNRPQTKVAWSRNRQGGIVLHFDLTEQDRDNLLIPVFELSKPL